MPLEPVLTAIGVFISILAGSAAIAGCLAYSKRRPPVEGLLLGLFLGPIGIVIEWRYPYIDRPMVDEKAWNSFHSMMDFQEDGRDYNRRR